MYNTPLFPGQLFVCSLLYHFPLIENNDVVGVFDGAEPVSHNQYCLSLIELMKVLHNNFLVVSIKRICCFIEEDIFQVLVHGTSYQQSLSLPLADSAAFHPDFSIVSHCRE